MASSIRLDLTPLPVPAPGSGPVAITGCRVELSQLGSGVSIAQRGSPQPAQIIFTGGFLKRARQDLGREDSALGTVAGTISLGQQDGLPVFVIAGPLQAAVATDASDPSSARHDRPRLLELEFGATNFQVPSGAAPFLLALPVDLEQSSRHLEVSAELSIAGQIEAPAASNDVLDVPLLPRRVFQLTLVDEVGQPIAGQGIELDFAGDVSALATDSDGIVSVANPPQSTAVVRFSDEDALRQELKSRWDSPREGVLVTPGPRVRVVPLLDPIADIQVVAGANVVSVQPPVTQASLIGMFFELNKNFLLPSAIPSLTQIKAIYDQNPNSKLLIVGHTDTSGDPSFNDPLSLERANAVAQYLQEDVDAWTHRYDSSVPNVKRWSSREDTLMIANFPGFDSRPVDQTPATFFQLFHNQSLSNPPNPNQGAPKNTTQLQVDGIIGDQTRRALIEDYMRLDGASLPAGIDIVTHGCGENFPLDDSGEGLDATPKDDQHDQVDRRVELFFFDGTLGVQPEPPGKNSKRGSKEYPEWRRRARESTDFKLDDFDRTLRIRLQDHGKAIADADYEIRVDGAIFVTGKTASDGLITELVPATAAQALIRLPALGLEHVVTLIPTDAFPPIDTVLGVQQRLGQLGFFFGTIDGQGGPITNSAIQTFKTQSGLPSDSVLDQPTRDAITQAYGS